MTEINIHYEKEKTTTFDELQYGDAYVTIDEPFIPCIKTGEDMCLYHYDGKWHWGGESGYRTVTPIDAKIEFFGVERK